MDIKIEKIIFTEKPRISERIKVIKTPFPVILPEAYQKLVHFIKMYPHEISGPGKVKLLEWEIPKMGITFGSKGQEEVFDVYSVLLIYDIFTVKTFNLPSHTDAQKGFTELYQKLIAEGKKDEIDDLRLWWHSHVDGSTKWSGEDDDTIFNFDCDYMISIVGNTRQEFRVRIDNYSSLRISIDDLPFPVFCTLEDDPMRKEVEEQIKKFAKRDNVFTRTIGKITKP